MSKIPDHAKVVYDGLIYQVYQREQRMYDGSVRTFEEIKRPASVFVLPIVDGKIIVSYQSQPHKDGKYRALIGGRLEKGENVLDGIKRELLEESGFQSEYLIPWFEKKTPVIQRNLNYYIAKGCMKITKPKQSNGEKITLFSLDFEVFVEMALQGVFQNEPLKDRLQIMVRDKRIDTLRDLFFV